jgi:type II secretory pathway component PulK
VKEHGFVLLTVLWVIALLGSAMAAGLWVARDMIASSENRILLTRAEWARDACEEILHRHNPVGALQTALDTVDLGNGLWCEAESADPRARLSLNHATPAQLRTLIADDSLVAALLDWRDPDDEPHPGGAEVQWYREAERPLPRNGPFGAVQELALVRGWDEATVGRFEALLTVESDGMLNLNASPAVLLRLVPGLTTEAIGLILTRRADRRPIQTSDEFLSLLSSPSRTELMAHYQEFSRLTAWKAFWLEVTITGGVGRRRPVAQSNLRMLAAEGRLVVLRREAE